MSGGGRATGSFHFCQTRKKVLHTNCGPRGFLRSFRGECPERIDVASRRMFLRPSNARRGPKKVIQKQARVSDRVEAPHVRIEGFVGGCIVQALDPYTTSRGLAHFEQG